MWERINHFAALGYKKVFGFMLSYPEFQFLGKILLAIVAIMILVLIFKGMFANAPLNPRY